MASINNDVRTNIIVSGTVDASFEGLKSAIDDDFLKSIGPDLANISTNARATNQQVGLLGRAFGRLNFAVKAFVAFELSRLFSDIVFGIGGTIAESQRLQTRLELVAESAEQARRQFDALASLSLEIPNTSANQLTEAFLKLQNLNLDTSEQALRDLADLSAQLGRPLPRLIEAIADASTFEFERLKEEFGIVARSINDDIQITFRGTTTTIDKSAEAIQGFLTSIAVPGAAAAQLETVGAQWARFVSLLAEGTKVLDEVTGASGFWENVLRDVGDTLEDILDRQSPAKIGEEITALNELLRINQARITEIESRAKQGLISQIDGYFQLAVLKRRDIKLNEALADAENELAQARVNSNLDVLSPQVNVIAREIQARESQILSISKYIAKLEGEEDQLVAVRRLREEIINLDQRGPDNLFGLSNSEIRETVKSLDELEKRIIRARNVIAAEKEDKRLAKAIADIAKNARTEAERALFEYERALRDINDAPSRIISESGFSRQELRDRLKDDFEQTLLQAIGPPVIEGVTARSIAAFNEQRRVLSEAVNLFGSDLQRDFEKQELQILAFDINEAILRAEAELDPLEGFRQRQLELQQRLEEGLAAGNVGLEAAYQKQLELARTIFGESFQINVDGFATVQEAIDGISTRAAEIRANPFLDEIFVAAELREANVELAKTLTNVSDFKTLLDSIQDGETRSLVEAIFGEERQDSLKLLEQDTINIYDAILSGEAKYLQDSDLLLRDRVALTAQAASEILGIWSENSRGIFELQKGLNIALIAIDATKAISAAIANFSANPFLGGIKLAGLVAKYASLIRDVTNREFGDGSLNGASGGDFTARDAQPANLFNSQGGGNTINIYGNVLDNNGFRRTVVDAIKEASNRDELTPEDFTETRF